MRFTPIVRPIPQPKLATPKLSSSDIARALTQVLDNQAAIMNDLAQIKNALPWLVSAPFEAAMVSTPAQLWALQATYAQGVSQALSD
jgi:hypothetical protein